MSITRETALNNLNSLLDHPSPGNATRSDDVDLERFALMILLCTNATLLDSTYPSTREINPAAVREFLPDMRMDVLEMMQPYRATFAAAQRAWFKLSDEYTDPPCPRPSVHLAVIQTLRSLG
jgi:hypothetical protein